MDAMGTAPARLAPRLLVAGLLALLGLVSASRMYFGYAASGHPISAFDALGSGLLEWGLWAPLLPLVRRLALAHGFACGRVLRGLVVHVPAALAASLAWIVLFALASAAIRELRFGHGDVRAEIAAGFLFKLHTGCVAYGAALAGFLAWAHAARSRDEALRRERADRALAEARLAAVQAQLSPHFLFNALNTISAFVRDDPDTAERMLARLGELLRAVLARREEPTQSLAEELAFLDAYLELQRERFGERLTVATRVDPAVLGEAVPSFLLLPLVENAVVHGVGGRSGPVSLSLRVERVDGDVRISIEDDGPGFHADERALGRRGLGLASVAERLRLLHGERGRCDLSDGLGGGAAIHLSFPARGMA